MIEASPLWQAIAEILQRVPGVGPGLSRMLSARIPELGTVNRTRITALVGVAPFNRDRGPFRGTRAIWGGCPDTIQLFESFLSVDGQQENRQT